MQPKRLGRILIIFWCFSTREQPKNFGKMQTFLSHSCTQSTSTEW